jgi:Zn-dependent metalloprotease
MTGPKKLLALGLLLAVSSGAVFYFWNRSKGLDEKISAASLDSERSNPSQKSEASKASKGAAAEARGEARKITSSRPTEAAMDRLSLESLGEWNLRTNSQGRDATLIGGQWPAVVQETNEQVSAAHFLAQFGRSLIAADLSDLRPLEPRKNEDSTDIIYQQYAHGLPVDGSRVLLLFNAFGRLVYFSSETAATKDIPPAQAIPIEEAREVFQRALRKYWRKSFNEEMPPNQALLKEKLHYVLKRGRTILVYKLEVSKPASRPGTLIGTVDARSGLVLSILSTAHK